MARENVISEGVLIRDNDPRNGKKRGTGKVVKVLDNNRAKVLWSGTDRVTEINCDRINDGKSGYSFVK